MGKRVSRTIAFPALAADKQLYNQGGMIRRTSFRETTGTTPAVFQLWDGTGVSGILLDPVTLGANESTRDQYKWDEYPIVGGIFAHVISGSVDVVIVITPEHECDDWGEPVVVIGQFDLNVIGG